MAKLLGATKLLTLDRRGHVHWTFDFVDLARSGLSARARYIHKTSTRSIGLTRTVAILAAYETIFHLPDGSWTRMVDYTTIL